MTGLERFIATLMQILRILSAPANEQIAYLEGLGSASVDELGLEFEDIWLQVDAALESKVITKYQYDAIKQLDMMLDQIGGEENESLWTEGALLKDEAWIKVRSLAKECLASFLDDPNTENQRT